MQSEGGCSWNERGGWHVKDCPHRVNVHRHRCCGLSHACTGADDVDGGCNAGPGVPCNFGEGS